MTIVGRRLSSLFVAQFEVQMAQVGGEFCGSVIVDVGDDCLLMQVGPFQEDEK